jgi:hypothetical protein
MKLKNFQSQINIATTDVTEGYYAAKESSNSCNKNVPDVLLVDLLQSASVEYKVPIDRFKKQTIYSRIRRKNHNGAAHQKIPPLHLIEPLLVEWCLKMAKNKSDLITGTEASVDFETFKK